MDQTAQLLLIAAAYHTICVVWGAPPQRFLASHHLALDTADQGSVRITAASGLAAVSLYIMFVALDIWVVVHLIACPGMAFMAGIGGGLVVLIDSLLRERRWFYTFLAPYSVAAILDEEASGWHRSSQLAVAGFWFMALGAIW